MGAVAIPKLGGALANWIGMFVDFLATKHGLAEVLRSDAEAFYTSLGYCHQPVFMSAVVGEWLANKANER